MFNTQMDKLDLLLYQLECCTFLDYNDLYRTLNEGVTDFSTITLPSKVKRMYTWRNGQNISHKPFGTGELDFCSFGKFLSLEDAEILNPEIDAQDISQSSDYFPLVSSLAGDYLVLNRKKERGRIYLYSPSITFCELEAVFLDLGSFLMTVYMCFEKRAYRFDSDNCLTVNYELETAIAKEYNKDIKYWRS